MSNILACAHLGSAATGVGVGIAVTMQIELTSLRNESDPLSAERREVLEQALQRTGGEAEALEDQWQAERKRLQHTKRLKRRLEEAKRELEVVQRKAQW
ncbi:hypothetical protein EI94DRAFT_1806697 [Lactarius quietus]|nr:hypothetical protein EI94DRAFT_1806697 [Lactarius quietus]